MKLSICNFFLEELYTNKFSSLKIKMNNIEEFEKNSLHDLGMIYSKHIIII